MCIAGNSRTFPDPRVQGNLSEFLGYLRQKESTIVDVFAYLTLKGPEHKDQAGWKFPEVDCSKKEVEAALAQVRPKAYELVSDAEEVTLENVFHYASDLDCLKQGVWRFPRNILRSLNQLTHLQRCLLLVLKEEEKSMKQYDIVLISRPDVMFYTSKITRPIIPTAAEGIVVYMWDWFFAMQREVMLKFLDRERAAPLTCRKSDWCCGKLGRSEDMFEYILQAPMTAPCNWQQYLCNHSYAFEHRSEGLEPGVAGDVLRPESSPTSADRWQHGIA